MVAEIERRGGRATVFPTIQTVPPLSWEESDRALASIGEYYGIIFTSVNAVEFFFHRLETKGLRSSDVSMSKIWALGEKTREAVERKGMDVSDLPEHFTSASLSQLLAAYDLKGKRLLLPQSDLARDALEVALRAQGAIPVPITVYRTVPAESAEREDILAEIRGGSIDAVAFASPSSAQNFVLMFSDLQPVELCRRMKVAAIGPTTRDSLIDLGISPDIVAAVSTGDGLIDAIEDYFETHDDE